LEFEWNEGKAEANLRAHGVSFELATEVFRDAFAIERLDDREDFGEERFVMVGMAKEHVLLFVAFARTWKPHSNHFSPESFAVRTRRLFSAKCLDQCPRNRLRGLPVRIETRNI
jgi:uncharacterized protein